MASIPKNHHYVPEMILRHFKSEADELFYHHKDSGKKIEHRNPRTIFCERHLYSNIHDDGTKSAALESDFASIESDAANLFDELQEITISGRLPELDGAQRDFFVQYLYLQWKRVPDVHGKFTSGEKLDATMQDILIDYRRDETKVDLIHYYENLEDERKKRLFLNAKVSALASTSPQIKDALSDREVVFVRPLEARSSFIIGSNPIVYEVKGKSGNADSSAAILLPISKSLVAGLNYPNRKSELLYATRSQIRQFNRYVFAQSTETASCSKKLLESLKNPR